MNGPLILIKLPFGKCLLGRHKTNGKTEMDLTDIAYDTDKLIAAGVKFYHFPQI